MPSPKRSALVLAALCSAPALAGTRLVPQQYPTIQSAITAAVPGDVVLVAPGVYAGPGNRSIDTMGKAITVRSSHGPATCTIDVSDPAGGARCGFIIDSFETSATVIEGFTISGGDQFNGGGIFISSSSPTIRDCVITGNRCDCWGAGIYAQGDGTPLIIGCVIAGNISAAEGGGIFTISNNAIFQDCIIDGNEAQLGGGACIFAGQPAFVNCLFTGNNALSAGGGLYLWQGTVTNCTITGNTAAGGGAAIFGGGAAKIANTIVWGHAGAAPLEGSTFGVSYSIVQGGFAGPGNLDIDPLFRDATAGDYQLLPLSPAIDAGANTLIPATVKKDLAGMPRFADCKFKPDTGIGNAPVVDMGAFELCAIATKGRLTK